MRVLRLNLGNVYNQHNSFMCPVLVDNETTENTSESLIQSLYYLLPALNGRIKAHFTESSSTHDITYTYESRAYLETNYRRICTRSFALLLTA